MTTNKHHLESDGDDVIGVVLAAVVGVVFIFAVAIVAALFLNGQSP